MFASLTQRIWKAVAADRALAHEVERNTEAEERTMRVIKQLAPTDYLLPIRRIATLGQLEHKRLTLPGLEKGKQLLATALFDEYAMKQAEIRDHFDVAVDRFAGVYPEILKAAPDRLKGAFRLEDFPAEHRIKEYFEYKVRFSPVPDGGNWLLDGVDGDQLSGLRNDIENEKNEMFREATKSLYERAEKVLDNLASQATNFKEGEANGGMLRPVTIDAVKEMAVLLMEMNITADPMLDAAGKEMMDKFGSLNAKDLRENRKERDAVAKAASKLLEKMKKAA
jgi:hypothetical protein